MLTHAKTQSTSMNVEDCQVFVRPKCAWLAWEAESLWEERNTKYQIYECRLAVLLLNVSKTDLTRFTQDEAPAVCLHFLPCPLFLLPLSIHLLLSPFSHIHPQRFQPVCERSRASGCPFKLDRWGGVFGISRHQRYHLLDRLGGKQVQLVLDGGQVEEPIIRLLHPPPHLRVPLLHWQLFLSTPSGLNFFPLSLCQRSAMQWIQCSEAKHHCLISQTHLNTAWQQEQSTSQLTKSW